MNTNEKINDGKPIVTSKSVSRDFSFAGLAALFFLAVCFPVPAVAIAAFLGGCICSTLSFCVKGRFVGALSVIPLSILILIVSSPADLIFPLFGVIVPLLGYLGVRFFKNKRYIAVFSGIGFSFLCVSIVLIAIYSQYGSLSADSFSEFSSDMKSTLIDYAKMTNALTSEQLAALPGLVDEFITAFLLLATGIFGALGASLGYLFSLALCKFLKGSTCFTYTVDRVGSVMTVSTFGSVFFLATSFISLFGVFGSTSNVISVLCYNFAFLYFPFLFAVGARSMYLRIKLKKGNWFYIVFLLVSFVISPVYPFILVAFTGASDTIAFRVQKKLTDEMGKNS